MLQIVCVDMPLRIVSPCSIFYGFLALALAEGHKVSGKQNMFASFSYTVLKLVACRYGIFPPISGFPPIERSHRSFLRSVQIR